MLMTLYKGPHQSPQTSSSGTSTTAAIDNKEWIVGSLLIIAATLAWSGLFILQGTLQASVLGLSVIRHPVEWALGWNINPLAAVYSGVVTSTLGYYIQGLCIRLKGPVFATTFGPLMMIIVEFMDFRSLLRPRPNQSPYSEISI